MWPGRSANELMLLRRRSLLWPLSGGTPVPGWEIRPRSEWTDVTPINEPEAEDVRFLLVHHSAGTERHRPEDVPRLLRGILNHHVQNRGWNDIAYNFLIDRHGGVWEGRFGSLDGPVRGDATGGNQGSSQLVCLIGDFTTEVPTEAAQRSLILTLAWLAERYSVDVAADSVVTFVSRGSNRWPEGTEVTTTPIAGHRDMSRTACPGDAFYPMLDDVIAPRVRAALAPTPSTTAPESTTTIQPTTTVTSATTTMAGAAATTAASSPPASLVTAAENQSGRHSLEWPLTSAVVGAAAALVGWRIRRMSRRR